MGLPLLAVPAIIQGVTATAGMTGSFIDMAKQRRARDKAEKAAAKAAAEAKAALAVAPFEALGLSIDPTQRAMDVATSIGMGGVEVGRESQRGAASAAGRAQAVGAQQAMTARDQFTKELEQRERLIAQDAARRQMALATIALEEAAGAQIAAGEAEASRRQSLQSGLKGLQQVGAAAAEGFDLYAGNRPAEDEAGEDFDYSMPSEERLSAEESMQGSQQSMYNLRQLQQNNLYLDALGIPEQLIGSMTMGPVPPGGYRITDPDLLRGGTSSWYVTNRNRPIPYKDK